MALRIPLGSDGAGWLQVPGDPCQGGFFPPVNSLRQRLFWGDMFPWVSGVSPAPHGDVACPCPWGWAVPKPPPAPQQLRVLAVL